MSYLHFSSDKSEAADRYQSQRQEETSESGSPNTNLISTSKDISRYQEINILNSAGTSPCAGGFELELPILQKFDTLYTLQAELLYALQPCKKTY